MGRRHGILAAACVAAGALTASTASAVAADPLAPDRQAQNLVLATTRQHDMTPDVEAGVTAGAAQLAAHRVAIQATDSERAPDPNGCPAVSACMGDPRLEEWDHGRGIVTPVLFTARDGATLSGRVWATRRGPAKRPGIVIDNGSIVGYERAYWWAAQALAKDGYVVLTFDAQGEGESDQLGASPDQAESKIAGTPPVGDGGPFYDGVVDALDFFLSTPAKPYVPRKSRTSGTSHADKQARRVAAGLNAGYNPYSKLLDAKRIGLTGHSFGAYATSYVAQADPRVDAEVAWDTLCVPKNSTRTELDALFMPDANGTSPLGGAAAPDVLTALPGDECMGAPPGYAPDVPIRTPALGLTGDYVEGAFYTSAPPRDYKARVSEAYSRAGVDSGQVVIRGGTHQEYSWLPNVHASLRGVDLATWYTAAWFDRYLKDDPTAARRLMSGRWRDDRRTAAVDPAGDPNALSEIYRSRMDIHDAHGTRLACEDLRAGCANLVPVSADCGPPDFGYLAVDRAPDDGRDPLVRKGGC